VVGAAGAGGSDLLRSVRPIEPKPYASKGDQRLLGAHNVTCSMSRRGNCHDNGAMVSFFSTLKAKLGERFESDHVAKTKLFDNIEVFCNQQPRHWSLGNMSSAVFERTNAQQTEMS
jgi:putative transposase